MRYELPDATFSARVDSFDTGLTGTIGVQILDSLGDVATARTTDGIIESPAGSGSYLATLTAPSTSGDYTIFWDAGTITPATTAGEQLNVTTTIPNWIPGSTPYATTSELFRVLKIRTPTPDQIMAAEGDLDTATLEINAEIDRADPTAAFTGDQIALLKGVCIDRAADLWRHRESIPGVLGGLDDVMPTTPGRYSWARYAARLSVLKDQWGIA